MDTEMNRTYNVVNRFAKRRQPIKSVTRRRTVKTSPVSTSTIKYGNNDLNMNLSTALLVLSPKLSSTVRKPSSCSTSTSSLSSCESSSADTQCIENVRCCNVVNTLTKNSASEIVFNEHEFKHFPQELPTIQEPFSSDDDGFYSDTQPQKITNEIGFKNQIKICRKTNKNPTINTKILTKKQQQEDNKCNNTDLLTTFNFNMASTPKSIRKSKKLSSQKQQLTAKQDEFDEFLNNKCASCYNQLSSTVKTTTTCCSGCCCCCCCCCSNSNTAAAPAVPQNLPIYLARSTSGYKLVQVIDDKVMYRSSRRKLNSDVKAKYNKQYLKSLKKMLPLQLNPIEEMEQTETIETTKTTQIVNCNAYIKKFIEKTKNNLKAQAAKKKKTTTDDSTGKKKGISLFQRRVKKSLTNENEFKIENVITSTENNENVNDNKSFVQNTFLSDFNQYGQFRVWYV